MTYIMLYNLKDPVLVLVYNYVTDSVQIHSRENVRISKMQVAPAEIKPKQKVISSSLNAALL